MSVAFIGVGSNIGPEKNIMDALILTSSRLRITGISTFYRTKPFDRPGQPSFYNGIIRIETEMGPHELYRVLKGIETDMGRQRSTDKSAPRSIDLDLLLFDDTVMHDREIHIPDPDIPERPYLAIPLFELERDLVLPGPAIPIAAIAEKLDASDMESLNEYTEKLRRNILYGSQKSGAPGQGIAD